MMQADIKRALEVINQAADSWVLRYTDFYTPPTVADILVNAKKLAGVEVFPWGGFQQAERCRLVVGKEELMAGAKLNLDEVMWFLLLTGCGHTSALPGLKSLVHGQYSYGLAH